MALLFVTWNLNPEIFNIGGFGIRWYGLLFACGYFLGYLILQKMFKWENIPAKLIDNLALYLFIGTVVGARLGHCLFYEPGYYLSNPLEILNIPQGGLASHGAAIGIILALWWFSRKEKRPFSWIIDRTVIVAALAGGLIRIGNLINSEIIGVPTTVPWAFVFKQVDNIPRHPTQIYEALACFFVFALLFWMYRRKNAGAKPYHLTGFFMILIFSFRFFIEYFKEVQVSFERTLPLDMGQWLSIPFIIAGIVLLANRAGRPIRRKNH